jgi:hypothetical protein
VGLVIAQVVRRWLVTLERRVQPRVTSCETRGGRSSTGAGFSPTSIDFPLLIIIPPLFHTHLSPPPPPPGCAIGLTMQHIITSSSSSSSSYMALQPISGLGLLFIRFRNLALKTVGRTPWTSDQPIARPLLTQDNTNTE